MKRHQSFQSSITIVLSTNQMQIHISSFLPIVLSLLSILAYIAKAQLWHATPTQGVQSYSAPPFFGEELSSHQPAVILNGLDSFQLNFQKYIATHNSVAGHQK